MSDYTEHLISMAGGDGDMLDAIQRRAALKPPFSYNWPNDVREDVEALLTLVRTQQATLATVLALANDSGRRGWHVSPDTIRKTLGAS